MYVVCILLFGCTDVQIEIVDRYEEEIEGEQEDMRHKPGEQSTTARTTYRKCYLFEFGKCHMCPQLLGDTKFAIKSHGSEKMKQNSNNNSNGMKRKHGIVPTRLNLNTTMVYDPVKFLLSCIVPNAVRSVLLYRRSLRMYIYASLVLHAAIGEY